MRTGWKSRGALGIDARNAASCGRKFAQRLVEIGLRRRRHAIGVLTKEDLVEIQLQDLFLAQRLLDPRGQDDLLDLALDRRSPDSRKFFITCWVMVEAPRTVRPRERTASTIAAAMPRAS